jgi:hypothetical protein
MKVEEADRIPGCQGSQQGNNRSKFNVMANVSEIEGGKKLIDRNPEGFIVCSK